jgi:hypothetical protein
MSHSVAYRCWKISSDTDKTIYGQEEKADGAKKRARNALGINEQEFLPAANEKVEKKLEV